MSDAQQHYRQSPPDGTDLDWWRAELQKDVEREKARVQAEYDRWRMEFERGRMEAEFQNSAQQAMFRGIIDFALAALRGVTLINGGAAIAVLALLGNIWTPDADGAKAIAAAIRPAMVCFVLGMVTGVLAAALSYFAQVAFAELRKQWPGHALRGVAVALAIAGLTLFGVGAIWAVDAFAT